MPRLAACPVRSRAGRAAVVVAALLAGVPAQPIAYAQPATDISRAKDLYRSAELAMQDGRFDDAARDYGGAYEWSKDPALFFKIGRANERAGRCDVALIYYARYLREGKPTAQFAATTRERIAACGGDARTVEGSASTPPAVPPADATAPAPPQAGSAGPGSAAEPAGAGGAASATEPAAGAGSAEPGSANAGTAAGGGAEPGSLEEGTAGATGAAAEGAGGAERPSLIPGSYHKAAWLMTGGAAALAALGGVLAFATNASENDVRDLYVGFAGQPPTFDGQTRRRYNELLSDGRRYQQLSWTAFGLAGATAAGAAVLFVLGRDEAAPAPRVAPVVTPGGAGVAVSF